MRSTLGFFYCQREHVLDSGKNETFSNKPKNKFVFFIIRAMANYKETSSLGVGEVLTSYNEVAKETGFTYAEVRWSISQLIKHKILQKKERQTGLHLKILAGVDYTTTTTPLSNQKRQTQRQTNDSEFENIISELSAEYDMLTTDPTAVSQHLSRQTNDNVCNKRSGINDPAVDHEPNHSILSGCETHESTRDPSQERKKNKKEQQTTTKESVTIYDQSGSYSNEPRKCQHDAVDQSDAGLSDVSEKYFACLIDKLDNFDSYFEQVRRIIKKPVEQKEVLELIYSRKIGLDNIRHAINSIQQKIKSGQVKNPCGYLKGTINNIHSYHPQAEQNQNKNYAAKQSPDPLEAWTGNLTAEELEKRRERQIKRIEEEKRLKAIDDEIEQKRKEKESQERKDRLKAKGLNNLNDLLYFIRKSSR